MALPPHQFIVPNAHTLPLELFDALNQTYFLHLLLCDPNKVIPRGKSLLSMLIHANFKLPDEKQRDDKHTAILDRVKEVAHRAFWAEALEALSSPIPSVQIPRLKQLYLDLYEALTPLFPPTHSILLSLSSPLPPTSSPLHSTVNLLKDILAALRQRCAPVRDATIDNLDMELAHPPLPKSLPSADDPAADTPAPTALAQFVIDKIKAILALAEDMKHDLNTFVLGSMTESQLRAVLLKDVRMRECQLVCNLWGGEENVRRSWAEWIENETSDLAQSHSKSADDNIEKRRKWVKRLLGALGSDKPVHCHFPTMNSTSTTHSEDSVVSSSAETATNTSSSTSTLNGSSEAHHSQPDSEPNQLPPQLLFSQPNLLYIQNYLQAIVIAAALRSLTRLPPPTRTKSDIEHDFMERVWTLLKAEIDADEDIPTSEGAKHEDKSVREEPIDAGHTKLINLADEVVRARQRVLASPSSATGAALPPTLDTDEEGRLRAAVERTLRTSDPVFLLLRKRLLTALEARVVDLLGKQTSAANSRNNTGKSIPVRMQTGKDVHLRDGEGERAGKRMRLMFPDDAEEETFSALKDGGDVPLGPVVPGFEEGVLQRAIGDVVSRIVNCGLWTKGVWKDLNLG